MKACELPGSGVRLSARAKINLTLYVLGKRPDGYHDLELIFQPVSLADELEIAENREDRLIFTCSVPEFSNEDNLVCRGYAAMRRAFPGKIPGLTIHLTKHIPSGAGLGGGSTDCSVLLVWLNRHYGLGLDREGLLRMGAALGADVPACMIPHATLGQGIGEKLSDIGASASVPLLLLQPDVRFSTAEMYGKVDSVPYDPAVNRNAQMAEALREGDAAKIAENLYNVFEEVVPGRAVVEKCRRSLLEAGALGSRMTGSGSAVFGIFADERGRDMAMRQLAGLPGIRVYSCETVNRPDELCAEPE